jgi:hypothetical protein
MSRFFNSFNIKLALILLCSIAAFTNCNEAVDPTNCDGYTGEVTNKSAAALQKKCHFMPKDSIDIWTARYQKNKISIANNSLPNATNVLGDSCSFNNSIVRAIITNDSCIGLRVINGMDASSKVHIILVGIKPDYTTLYIKKPKDCGEVKSAAAKGGDPDDDPDGDLGGGEYADMP